MKKTLFLLVVLLTANSYSQDVSITNILPNDGDTIQTKLPCLSWVTNLIYNVNDERSYLRLVVVKLDQGQSAQSGIAVNVPLVKMEHLNANQVFYPFDAPELQFEERYGWQVQAITNDVVVGSSEAWEFTLHENKIEYTKFATLKLYSDGTEYVASGGKVFFILDDPYRSEQLNIQVVDDQQQVVFTAAKKENVNGEKEGTNAIALGNNYYELNVGTFCKPGVYQLIVQNGKKQKFLLDFIVP